MAGVAVVEVTPTAAAPVNPSSIRISERTVSLMEVLPAAFYARSADHPIVRPPAEIATAVEVTSPAAAPVNPPSI